jgi:predicted PolB exonuclease-like 3'-5' exonuclease
MYTQSNFKNYLFIDIETASQFRSLDELQSENPRLAEQWVKKAENVRRFEHGMEGFSDEELYEKTAAWFPEFGKVIVISIGQVKFDEYGTPLTANIRSFYGDDEKAFLEEFNGVAQAVFNKNPNVKLIGHNIKQFDMPWLVRRSLINRLKVPSQFHFQKQKPWENCLEDTYEIWKFGGRSGASLDAICTVMGVPSPKEKMNNDEVSDNYWEGKLETIKEYCEDDVKATMNVMLSLSGLDYLS